MTMNISDSVIRCGWCTDDPLYQKYHDEEWGIPLHDDQQLFEFLLLEGAQAGLSWITVLKKREGYRQAFDGFNAEKIARYSPKKIERLMQDSSIIRNRLKINSAIKNAQAYLKIQETYSGFQDFIWQFTEGKTIQNTWRTQKDVPASTNISDIMSKTLKKHGFSFVGSTICYAFMQATGMVNDHTVDCHRHKKCLDLSKS